MSEQPTRPVEAVDSEAVPNAAADGPTGAPQLSSIGRAASLGLRWSLIGNIITKLGSFILALVLARLLSPADFGTYAIALGAMYFLMHVNDVGIIAARGSVAGTWCKEFARVIRTSGLAPADRRRAQAAVVRLYARRQQIRIARRARKLVGQAP